MALEITSYTAKNITAAVQGEGPTWSTLEITILDNDGSTDSVVLHFDDVAGIKIAKIYAAAINAALTPERAAA